MVVLSSSEAYIWAAFESNILILQTSVSGSLTENTQVTFAINQRDDGGDITSPQISETLTFLFSCSNLVEKPTF